MKIYLDMIHKSNNYKKTLQVICDYCGNFNNVEIEISDDVETFENKLLQAGWLNLKIPADEYGEYKYKDFCSEKCKNKYEQKMKKVK